MRSPDDPRQQDQQSEVNRRPDHQELPEGDRIASQFDDRILKTEHEQREYHQCRRATGPVLSHAA